MTDSTPKPKRVPPSAFKKGDPRINRKGRPKSFDALRSLAQAVAHEEVTVKTKREDGTIEEVPLVVDGKKLTTAELIVRSWAESSRPELQKAFIELAFGKTPDKPAEEPKVAESDLPTLPVDLIAPDFFKVYRDIKAKRHTEYVLYGGRGSTKSSFISLMIIWLIVNNPRMHGLITRQVANTLRDSVYAQIIWAITELGMTEKFKYTVSPMEVEYIPTGQKIFFRGADDPGKLKSIKPSFGFIGILWLEELDQYHGPEAVRKIEQSVIRGGDTAFVFKSFNPPRTANNWANKYIKIPKDSQYQHASNYLSVPREWLGEPWLAEAEHLKTVNPLAYEHEYLGIANSAGGMVFENVTIRKITDEEIAGFERVLNGLDFGYYPDPAHYSRSYYDPARMKLYIFGEVRRWKTSNREMYDAIKAYGYSDGELLIADSAEPKSVGDFRDYGATCRGAEKGKESLNYSMKWLQSLSEIVIDNERCPETAEEFLGYEFERTKDDEIISAYPDKDNHAIDSVRYGTNFIWKRRGG